MKQEKKMTLSTQGYRGTRDFYPADIRLQSYLYQKIHQVMNSFCYEEYSGPFLEHLELYASKTSEEIVKDQLYSFLDKGERTLAIRPEMTPTLARMVAAKAQQLSKPVRWYSIPTCMRFERPQRGRLREFNQLNVDVFGGLPLDEDIEILLTIIHLFKSLGASLNDFEILVSHRGLVNSFFNEILKLDSEKHSELLRLLDKKDKLSAEDYKIACDAIPLNKKQFELTENFISSDIHSIANLFESENEYVQELEERIKFVSKLTNSECVKFAPNITRGFDYYTGMVFEVFDTNPKNRRALFGGGRFDNLVSAFGADPLPGVGYGVSDVALLNFMEVHHLTPQLSQNKDVCVLRFQSNDRSSQLELSEKLRTVGLAVDTTISDLKFGKQIAHANRLFAKTVAFRGDEELKNETFCVKFLSTGEQRTYPYSENGILEFSQQVRTIN